MVDPAIVVVAAPREHPNVHATLAGMLLADPAAARLPITVVWDSTSAEPFEPYGDAVRVEPLSVDELGPTFSHWRSLFGHLRALRAAPRGRPVIVLEDDVRFTRQWLAKLARIIDEASDAGPDFAVWGYCRLPLRSERAWTEYPACEATRGSLLMYLPAHVVEPMAEAMARSLRLVRPVACDDLYGHWCRANGARPIVAVPSLVQHVGAASVVNPTQRTLGDARSPVFEP